MALPLLLLPPPPHTHGCCYAAGSSLYTGEPWCRLCLSLATALLLQQHHMPPKQHEATAAAFTLVNPCAGSA
jgi:hypothetical protein